MAIETSLFYRVLSVKGKQYKLEAPTVGLSIQLLYVMERPKEPDFEDVFLSLLNKLEFADKMAYSELLRVWKLFPFEVTKAVKKAIVQGYSLPDGIKKDENRSGKKQEWSEIITEFCHIYQVDPYRVVQEYPFSFFLELYNQLGKLKYRKRIETGLATGFGFGSVPKKFTEKWFDHAGYTEPKPEPKKKKVADTPEEIEKKITEEYELLKQRS